MVNLLKTSDENQTENQKEIDLWLIRDNLKLSYEARVAQHQNTLDCIAELKQIGLANRAKPTTPSRISGQKPSSKKALGRHRDLVIIEELEAIKNEK